MKYEEVKTLSVNEEYDKMIKVKEIPSHSNASPVPTPIENTDNSSSKPIQNKNEIKKKITKNKKNNKNKSEKEFKKEKKKKNMISPETELPAENEIVRHLPEIEDNEGFLGRRPTVDPFKPDEKIVFFISYFGVKAGELTLETLPYVEVNGKKSYHFIIRIKSYSFFDRLYAVDDWAETFLDFQNLTPYNLAVHVKESKQLKESRSVYDFTHHEASFWEKQITKEKGEKNKKLTWTIEDFSQNVLSAIYYVRTFTFRKGKVVLFRIADAGKNILFRAEVVREEKLTHEKSELNTFVLKLDFKQDGFFQKTGDVFLWLTQDERKFPVRIESKIKIGTLVGALKELKP